MFEVTRHTFFQKEKKSSSQFVECHRAMFLKYDSPKTHRRPFWGSISIRAVCPSVSHSGRVQSTSKGSPARSSHKAVRFHNQSMLGPGCLSISSFLRPIFWSVIFTGCCSECSLYSALKSTNKSESIVSLQPKRVRFPMLLYCH